MKRGIFSVLKCLAIVGAFWVLILFGPALVSLVNTMDTIIYGMGYKVGSLGYKVLSFLSQPIACAIAASAAEHISKKEHDICVLVNEIIAICIFVLFAIFMFFVSNNIFLGSIYVVSAAMLIYCSAKVAQNFSNNKN